MSAETRKAMDEAIAAHFADENEATITGWALVSKGKRIEQIGMNTSRYLVEISENMEYDVALGMFHYGVLNIEDAYNDDEEL